MSSVTTPRTPWVDVALAALVPIAHALLVLGRLHPDEVYQSLEMGLFKAFGFGIVPWEWQVPPNPAPDAIWGIRNWSVPLLFAGLLKASAAVGLESVMGRRAVLAIPQFLLQVAMLAAVFRLARRRLEHLPARVCLWLVALYAPVVWFAGRPMSESFSVAFLVWGLERLDDRSAGWRAALVGGVLLGLAQVTRSGSAALILPALLVVLAERRWKAAGAATVGGLLIAAGLGVLDRLTWGEWFHSLIHYVRFNVTSGAAAAQFGAEPWWWYAGQAALAPFAVLGLVVAVRPGRARGPLPLSVVVSGLGAALVAWKWSTAPVWVGPALATVALCTLVALVLRADDLAPRLLVIPAIAYALVISATAHKEARFLYPSLVLLAVAGAVPLLRWATETGQVRKGLCAVVVAAGATLFVFPSAYAPQRPGQFQFVAHAARDTTGLVIMNEGVWGSPGFFYLGKNVPWFACDFPWDPRFQQAMRTPTFNRGVFTLTGDAERDRQTRAAFTEAGFRVTFQRGETLGFERP